MDVLHELLISNVLIGISSYFSSATDFSLSKSNQWMLSFNYRFHLFKWQPEVTFHQLLTLVGIIVISNWNELMIFQLVFHPLLKPVNTFHQILISVDLIGTIGCFFYQVMIPVVLIETSRCCSWIIDLIWCYWSELLL